MEVRLGVQSPSIHSQVYPGAEMRWQEACWHEKVEEGKADGEQGLSQRQVILG